MPKYIVVARTANIPVGSLISLTDEQASVRMHNLERAGKGQYRTTAHIEFIKNEIIGLPDKTLRQMVMGQVEPLETVVVSEDPEPVEDEQPKKSTRKK